MFLGLTLYRYNVWMTKHTHYAAFPVVWEPVPDAIRVKGNVSRLLPALYCLFLIILKIALY